MATATVQRRLSGAKMTQVEARMGTSFSFVTAATDRLYLNACMDALTFVFLTSSYSYVTYHEGLSACTAITHAQQKQVGNFPLCLNASHAHGFPLIDQTINGVPVFVWVLINTMELL